MDESNTARKEATGGSFQTPETNQNNQREANNQTRAVSAASRALVTATVAPLFLPGPSHCLQALPGRSLLLSPCPRLFPSCLYSSFRPALSPSCPSRAKKLPATVCMSGEGRR